MAGVGLPLQNVVYGGSKELESVNPKGIVTFYQ